MTKSTASKLLRQGIGVPGTSRRAQYSASTKRALVDVAERLFTDAGYAGASLDAIVAGAEVTKGALYHHFHGKRALFEAVFEKVEGEAVLVISKAMKEEKDPWEKAVVGLRTFLQVVQQPTYRRVVVQEGPAVLGYERFREHEERSSYAIIHDMVAAILTDKRRKVDDLLLQSFSSIFFGAMSAAGELVADSDDPAGASHRVEVAIGYIISGMQLVREAGVELPTTEDFDAGSDDGTDTGTADAEPDPLD